jgi:hypothetical protein
MKPFVARLVEDAMPIIARGEVVEIGLAPGKPRERVGRAINRPWRRVVHGLPESTWDQLDVKPAELEAIQPAEAESHGVSDPDSAPVGAEEPRQPGPRLGPARSR